MSPNNSEVQLSAAITAWASIKMYLRNDCVYTDAKSVFIKDGHSLVEERLSQTELGMLKLEAKAFSFIFISQKVLLNNR